MRVLIAPDKFKGTLTARQACEAIASGISEALPFTTTVSIPMADGGEGTCDLLTEIDGGSKVKVNVLNPAFREIESEYGLSRKGDVAFIEMAKASGLQLLDPLEKNPMLTTTIGTGQLIAHALGMNVKQIILCVGGSGTTDGGIGMASALGYEFYSKTHELLAPQGKNLSHLKSIDAKKVHQSLHSTRFVVIYDVSNPLYGDRGAARVFSRQKGATPEDIELLDQGLVNFAHVVEAQFHQDVNFPGAGAGGGLAGGAKVFLNASFSPGIDFISQFTNLEDQVRNSDLVITGEGKIDEQTFSGKVVMGVARLASQHGKKCIAFCGRSELTETRLGELGLSEVVALSRPGEDDRSAFTDAFQILKTKVKQIAPGWAS